MSADRIESLVNLTAGLTNETRAALLRAIADLMESSPWDAGILKFVNPTNAPAKGHDDKLENQPVDDIEKLLREEADRLDPKTKDTTHSAGSSS